jgi:serine protease
MSARSPISYIYCLFAIGLVTGSVYGQAPHENEVSAAPQIVKLEATPEAIAAAEKLVEAAADRSRRMRAALTFEDFKATVYREPFEGGAFIVSGDTPIFGEKQLREYFEKEVKPKQSVRLILSQIGGMANKWNHQQKMNLTYCISTAFGTRHDNVVEQMASATASWEQVAAIDFIHDASQDTNCNATNTAVVFDVRPVNVSGKYFARAFFPRDSRPKRNILIDESSFSLNPEKKLTLAGILRHELGHALGYLHEHIRPESGKCFEDEVWLQLTNYDAFSVMHYPQCNGLGDWSLILTARDQNGAACTYGAAPRFRVDSSLITNSAACFVPITSPPGAGPVKVQRFSEQTVEKNSLKQYGPFQIASGTLFAAKLAGTSGDPDLYVRFYEKPKVNDFDCRPYDEGAIEECALTVPNNATEVFVMVRGYSTATYDLQIQLYPSATTSAEAQ